MYGLVILPDVRKKAAADFFKGMEIFAIMSSDEFKKGKKSSPLFEEGLNVTINCWVLSASHSFV